MDGASSGLTAMTLPHPLPPIPAIKHFKAHARGVPHRFILCQGLYRAHVAWIVLDTNQVCLFNQGIQINVERNNVDHALPQTRDWGVRTGVHPDDDRNVFLAAPYHCCTKVFCERRARIDDGPGIAWPADKCPCVYTRERGLPPRKKRKKARKLAGVSLGPSLRPNNRPKNTIIPENRINQNGS